MGIEPTTVQLLDWRSILLSYWNLDEKLCVSGTLYRIMRVDFHDFGIFDRKQFRQGPKSKLLENSRPTACYFQWNSWKLWSLIFRYWYIFMLVSKFCTKAIYLLGYLFMIAWLGSWRLRGRKNVSVGHETSISSSRKGLGLFLFL